MPQGARCSFSEFRKRDRARDGPACCGVETILPVPTAKAERLGDPERSRILRSDCRRTSYAILKHRRKIQVADFPSLMGKPQLRAPPPLSLLTTNMCDFYHYQWQFL